MTQTSNTSDLRNGPDDNGLFGAFGGRYVAETLMPLSLDLAANTKRPRKIRHSKKNWPTSSVITSDVQARCISLNA